MRLDESMTDLNENTILNFVLMMSSDSSYTGNTIQKTLRTVVSPRESNYDIE